MVSREDFLTSEREMQEEIVFSSPGIIMYQYMVTRTVAATQFSSNGIN